MGVINDQAREEMPWRVDAVQRKTITFCDAESKEAVHVAIDIMQIERFCQIVDSNDIARRYEPLRKLCLRRRLKSIASDRPIKGKKEPIWLRLDFPGEPTVIFPSRPSQSGSTTECGRDRLECIGIRFSRSAISGSRDGAIPTELVLEIEEKIHEIFLPEIILCRKAIITSLGSRRLFKKPSQTAGAA